MQFPVIVRTEQPGQFTAQPLGIPELRATAKTAAEAIAQVSRLLMQMITSALLVQVDVPVPAGNPWLDSFGRSANDPDFDDYLEEIKRARSTDPAK